MATGIYDGCFITACTVMCNVLTQNLYDVPCVFFPVGLHHDGRHALCLRHCADLPGLLVPHHPEQGRCQTPSAGL